MQSAWRHRVAAMKKEEDYGIIKAYWPSASENDPYYPKQYEVLIKYISSEIDLMRNATFAVRDRGRVLEMIREGWTKRTLLCNEYLQQVHPPTPQVNQENMVDDVERGREGYTRDAKVCLSAKTILGLILMLQMNINVIPAGQCIGDIPWLAELSLGEFVKQYFRQLQEGRNGEQIPEQEINPDLTAMDLKKCYGMKLRWTHRINEHLVLTQNQHGKYTLRVFEHRIWVRKYLEVDDSIIPLDVLLELEDTFNLLFPQHPNTKKFLDREGKRFYGLGSYGRCRKLKVSEYSYWKYEVAKLVRVADLHRGWRSQIRLGKDRSDLLELSNSVVGLMVFSLTILALVLGIIVHRVTLEGIELARDQLQVARDQACMDLTFKREFPNHCGRD